MDIEKALQMAVKVAAGFQPIDTNSAICRLAEEVLDLRTALASAKEEIERLTADNCKPAEDVCELCQPLTDMHARAEAAESALASERKETERLREAAQIAMNHITAQIALGHLGPKEKAEAQGQLDRAEAALQSRQGEE